MPHMLELLLASLPKSSTWIRDFTNDPIALSIVALFYSLVAIAGIFSFRWLIWIVFSLVLGLAQLLYAVYQLGRIGLTITALSLLKVPRAPFETHWRGVNGVKSLCVLCCSSG